MIEIVSIGNEILSGKTVNTNAAFISEKLREIGLVVTRHTVLPDQKQTLRKGLKEALDRSDLVIATGGLGPTFDDVTKSIACELFDATLIHSEEVAKDLTDRFGPNLSTLENQSLVPDKARLFINPLGTAPSFGFPKDSPKLILLPGVPREMEAMMEKEIIPLLKKQHEKSVKFFQKEMHLCLLWESHVSPFLDVLIKKYPHIEFGIYPAYGLVSIHFRTEAKDEVEANALFEPAVKELREKYKTYLFSYTNNLIEEAVHNSFIKKNKTLVLAESCTGGKIASRLTALAGASGYFLGSVVSYSNSLKQKLLGVKEKTLETQGAVSAETVEEMLLGAFALSDADYAISVSGIAGPTGGTPEKPVGTVWYALGAKGEKPEVGLIPIQKISNRRVVIEYCATFVLAHLWRKISGVTGG